MTPQAACTGKHCHVDTDTCIILQGPSHLMPKTKRPPRCFLEAVPPSVSRQVFLQRSAADTGGRVNCSGGIWTSFLYKPNPDLTVMLSYGDRSLVNLHLIHTSYFLFFVVMTLACYAIIRGTLPQGDHGEAKGSSLLGPLPRHVVVHA
ncbi:hypothetical protein MRX96_039973 [Rhipicephalus microplus]